MTVDIAAIRKMASMALRRDRREVPCDPQMVLALCDLAERTLERQSLVSTHKDLAAAVERAADWAKRWGRDDALAVDIATIITALHAATWRNQRLREALAAFMSTAGVQVTVASNVEKTRALLHQMDAALTETAPSDLVAVQREELERLQGIEARAKKADDTLSQAEANDLTATAAWYSVSYILHGEEATDD